MIAVETMAKCPTTDIKTVLAQIQEIANRGADRIRIAVPDKESSRALFLIRKKSPIPIIADVHFHLERALDAFDAGVSCVRINPGNMKQDKIARVIEKAKETNTTVRIGINEGSVPEYHESPEYWQSYFAHIAPEKARILATFAIDTLLFINSLNFDNLELSIKSFDIENTIIANRLVHAWTTHNIKHAYHWHIGITEAGPPPEGIVRATIGIAKLLESGIGDLIRVSLTASPVEEVIVGNEILKTLGYRKGMVIVSCPTCGRCNVPDFFEIVRSVKSKLGRDGVGKVAVMGCMVNGIGEGKNADVGIAFGQKGRNVLFTGGHQLETFSTVDNGVNRLVEEVNRN